MCLFLLFATRGLEVDVCHSLLLFFSPLFDERTKPMVPFDLWRRRWASGPIRWCIFLSGIWAWFCVAVAGNAARRCCCRRSASTLGSIMQLQKKKKEKEKKQKGGLESSSVRGGSQVGFSQKHLCFIFAPCHTFFRVHGGGRG